MRIGILDILHDTMDSGWGGFAYGFFFRKQFMGIMPQTISVWCRSLGHDVRYATYWGQADPLGLLSHDLDAVFISSYTQSSALAYAIASALRKRGTLTVLGGPHARSFPIDSLRFFDIVVKECDRQLVDDILHHRIDPPAIVSSGRSFFDIPSVEERMPEIRRSAFYGGKPRWGSTVPLLSSVGCPYRCDFCVDWDSNYVLLPAERLLSDLTYLSEHYPATLVSYHDPNFAVAFDQTMNIIDRIPESRRNPYIMESSLSVLKPARLSRLNETKCIYVAPGVESWTDYSDKSGTKTLSAREKLEKVVEQLHLVGKYIPGIQVNFLFGIDSDQGDEPIALTKEFVQRMPQVWPAFNIPSAFGGTPLYDQLYKSGRILQSMPFAFYYSPYLAILPSHYDPMTFYDHLIDLYEATTTNFMLARRLMTKTPPLMRFLHGLRTLKIRAELKDLRGIRALFANKQFRAFHEGRSDVLPSFYDRLFDRRLGRYSELLSYDARRPILEPARGHDLSESNFGSRNPPRPKAEAPPFSDVGRQAL